MDDAEEIRLLVSTCLRQAGYEVEVAGDGAQALERLRRDPLPALVLLDVMMPEVNGFEVCRSLREDARTRDLPVVLLTSRSQPSDKFWGMDVGASHYMTKPFELQKLLQTVSRFVPS
ncbi:MAG: response regulator [Planctomycetes bacterium]|nr:response regulator [Planctomycetota bacterium]